MYTNNRKDARKIKYLQLTHANTKFYSHFTFHRISSLFFLLACLVAPQSIEIHVKCEHYCNNPSLYVCLFNFLFFFFFWLDDWWLQQEEREEKASFLSVKPIHMVCAVNIFSHYHPLNMCMMMQVKRILIFHYYSDDFFVLLFAKKKTQNADRYIHSYRRLSSSSYCFFLSSRRCRSYAVRNVSKIWIFLNTILHSDFKYICCLHCMPSSFPKNTL